MLLKIRYLAFSRAKEVACKVCTLDFLSANGKDDEKVAVR